MRLFIKCVTGFKIKCNAAAYFRTDPIFKMRVCLSSVRLAITYRVDLTKVGDCLLVGGPDHAIDLRRTNAYHVDVYLAKGGCQIDGGPDHDSHVCG